jgi:branched-chain amino acid transport system permease protein
MINKNLPQKRIAAIGFGLLLAVLLPFIVPYTSLASEILIFAIFAMAYNLMLGYAGMLSFGHAMFFGLGAYTTGLIVTNLYPSIFLGLAASALMGALLALPVGFLSIRRHGIYFTMVTLAFAQLLYFIAFKWSSLTGGDDGLQNVPRPSLGPISLNSEIALYYFILIITIVCMIMLIKMINSPFGRTLQAVRENKNRALSIGYDIDRFKLVTFIISGFFSGLAGGLYALLLNFVPLSSLFWTTSGDVVVMTVIGGMGTIFGPVIGAAFTILLRDILSNFTESWNTIMGVLFMATVLGFQGGIMGIIRKKFDLQ